ncbi:transcription cofactor vestigial-like protein 1 [Mus pahari]|uniref:transcription cofactor vestigial-like protein 1 n=1 Tax=Mus pahari TaxID=10093 RepID=UPI000A309620|nr:transcription cofactor vestigial-like protein 1 [Mus pahari]
MEEMKKNGVWMPRSSQKPVKTEWKAGSVIFTYFEGDVNSMVDEHFSRALRNLKRPHESSSSSHSDNVTLKNGVNKIWMDTSHTDRERKVDNSMPPNQRHLSSWAKPQLPASPENEARSSSLDEYGPKAMDQHSVSMPKIPSALPLEPWHFSSLVRPGFLAPAYFPVFPDRHLTPEFYHVFPDRRLTPEFYHVFPDRRLTPEVYPDVRYGSLQHLVQQDRYQSHRLEPAARENRSPAKIAGSTGSVMNPPPNSVHYKKRLYAREAASASLDDERSPSPKRRRDAYYY